jgi:hypothetical protein
MRGQLREDLRAGCSSPALSSSDRSVQVQTCRIDDIQTDRVDLIKIDIEGHEPAALDGMKTTLARDHPVILTEANDYWLRTWSNSSASDYIQQLISLGYDVYDVRGTTHSLDASISVKPLDVIDLLAVPPGTNL